MRRIGERMAAVIACLFGVGVLFSLSGENEYFRCESSIGKGVSLLTWNRRGLLPGRAWGVKFDMSAQKFRIAVVMNPSGSNVTATVSDLAREANGMGCPVAGINADAFGYDKSKMENPAHPFGLVISGGRVLNCGASWLNQTDELFLVETEAGELRVSKPSFPAEGLKSTSNDVAFEDRRAREAVHVLRHVVKSGEFIRDDSDGCTISPGTYFGFGENVRMMLVTDGRRMSCPFGLTARDVSILFCREGCTEVVQFDGGGSSTLWVEKRGVVNSPCDGASRRVANALFVLRNEGGATDFGE